MASPELWRAAACLPGPASCASSGAAASGPGPRPPPRAPPPRAASAAAHGGVRSSAGTRTRIPEPPASDRDPPGSAAAAAAAPKGPAASCKGPALRPRRPALQSHPGARGPSGAAPASHQLRLGLRGRPRGSRSTVTPSALSLCGARRPRRHSSPSLRLGSVPSRRSRPSPAVRQGELAPADAPLVPGCREHAHHPDPSGHGRALTLQSLRKWNFLSVVLFQRSAD